MKICPRCERVSDLAEWRCHHCGYEVHRRPGYIVLTPGAPDTSTAFDSRSFTDLSQVAEGSFWFRARDRLITWALDRYFPAAASFLDLGCGDGQVLKAVARSRPGITLSGGELSETGLERAARALPTVALYQIDALHVPFEAEFDVIGAFDVLEHIEEDERVMREIFRAVRPGGGVLISVPQHPFLWSAVDEYAKHRRRYTRRELVEKLQRADFRVDRVTSFVSLVLPAMVMSRIYERVTRRQFDPLGEHNRAAFLDRALSTVMGVEHSLIRGGISFPFGGSLLAVARRPS